jgi:membrane protein YdbS with pleckstrin-like domain
LAKDEQIGVLLETSNAYRSVVALLVCALATGGWVASVSAFPSIETHAHYILLLCLLVLFLFAYRKQTQYIVARIELQKDKNEAS